MRIFKTMIIAAFAITAAAGTLFAADDPLEIHGGGRVGIVTNGKLGAERGLESNELGSMPNYGTSNYMALSFSKKVTADNGAWAKTVFAFDDWRQFVGGDLSRFTLRLRDFHEEFGGLDFLPAGSVLWAGLTGNGAGWNGQQDHAFINFAGIGFGLKNIGGVFSIGYAAQQLVNTGMPDEASWAPTEDATTKDKVVDQQPADKGGHDGLGFRVTHNIIASVNIPVLDVFGVYGYSKKAKGSGEANYNTMYVGGIFHAPVMGLNLGAAYATNGIARQMQTDRRSDTFIRNQGSSFVSGAKSDVDGSKYNAFSLAAWTVTDLAEGLYTATSISYDMIKGDKKASEFTNLTHSDILASIRISKALTKNIAFCPTFGYGRTWENKDTNGLKKAASVYQVTPAVEIGLNTGYWAGQKVQFYGVYTKHDSKHKFGTGAYTNKTSALDFGTLVTFGF